MGHNHKYSAARRALMAALLGVSTLVTGLANAELIEYSITTREGEARKLPADTRYANPTGDIGFAVSAGIDRRVRVTILRPDGSQVSTVSSHLLGADDRITAADGEYYGAILNLAAPGDGEYLIKTETLDSSGNPLEIDEYPLYIDTTAPTTNGIEAISLSYGQYKDGSIWKLGSGGVGLAISNIRPVLQEPRLMRLGCGFIEGMAPSTLIARWISIFPKVRGS
ncbi:DUF4165 domain-containing protein [Halomonas sp. E19]|uniref:DUF4165 domain-containing protein n=1 Tax=Halomonas sp. E19 TaxID=3397247 RepID=UPI004034D3B0